jgi:putative transposase
MPPLSESQEKLRATLDECRELSDAALEERRDAWSSHRHGIRYLEQANQLGDIKAVREGVRAVHGQVLQDALRRMDKPFQAFFLRCKRGQVPGFPCFRSMKRLSDMSASVADWLAHETAHRRWKYEGSNGAFHR